VTGKPCDKLQFFNVVHTRMLRLHLTQAARVAQRTEHYSMVIIHAKRNRERFESSADAAIRKRTPGTDGNMRAST
jgi:hypothetical protein